MSTSETALGTSARSSMSKMQLQALKLSCAVELSCAVPAYAANPEVHFAISSYVVDGALQVPVDSLQAAVRPYVGPSETFGAKQSAAMAVQQQQLYMASGYSAAEVSIPQQDISPGIVRLKVVEPHIGNVSVIGNQHFDVANIRASKPSLSEGQMPNIRAIGSAIWLANESYARQTQISFKQAVVPESAVQSSGLINAMVHIADVDPIRHIISSDIPGSEFALPQ